jgi:UDP-glucose 4-epimerase
LRRSLVRSGIELFSPEERFTWHDDSVFASQLSRAVDTFAARIGPATRWEIYWAAGVGTMTSPEPSLTRETRSLSLLLRLIESTSNLMTLPGAIGLASSAGAIYAGSVDDVITENSTDSPTTPYALEKVRQEDIVRSFVLAHENISALLARLSTLYGPGHSIGKPQGLITHMARCILNNKPIQIYVPFDTIRDYLAADDAANAMTATLGATSERRQVLVKIIASERPTTIAEIIATFTKLARRSPRVITGAAKSGSLYSRRIQFRSIVARAYTAPPQISLTVGIAQVMASERAAFAEGQRIGSK